MNVLSFLVSTRVQKEGHRDENGRSMRRQEDLVVDYTYTCLYR